MREALGALHTGREYGIVNNGDAQVITAENGLLKHGWTVGQGLIVDVFVRPDQTRFYESLRMSVHGLANNGTHPVAEPQDRLPARGHERLRNAKTAFLRDVQLQQLVIGLGRPINRVDDIF